MESPEEPKLGLLCFLNDTRECNASCMSYITYPAGCAPEFCETQSHCMLLVSAERMSRHLTIIASLLNDGEKKRRIAEADSQRARSAPTPLIPKPMSPFPKKND
jgi:hypothetical protein